MVSGMRTVYWLGKEHIATEKYNYLMKLLKLQGCKDIENLNPFAPAYGKMRIMLIVSPAHVRNIPCFSVVLG